MTEKQEKAVKLLNDLLKYENIDNDEYFLLLGFVTGERIVTYNATNTSCTVFHEDSLKKVMDMRFDNIADISVRLRNILLHYDIRTLGDASRHTERELLNMRNFGFRSVTELQDILIKYGLDFKKE